MYVLHQLTMFFGNIRINNPIPPLPSLFREHKHLLIALRSEPHAVLNSLLQPDKTVQFKPSAIILSSRPLPLVFQIHLVFSVHLGRNKGDASTNKSTEERREGRHEEIVNRRDAVRVHA